MQDLLPFYERELSFLRQHVREFAERYPKVAGNLRLAGDVSQDPHVERMIESFALLSARVSKKLDDEYPEFTDALLSVLYPHYLRPFPACSIAQLGGGSGTAHSSTVKTIPRGTELRSRPVRGLPCRFRTAYDVLLAPFRVQRLQYQSVARPPNGIVLPPGSTGQLSLELELTNPQHRWDDITLDEISLFIDCEPASAAALSQTLCAQTLAVYTQTGDAPEWQVHPDGHPTLRGFDDNETLIDYPPHAQPAFRVLTEYFAYPEKFNFLSLPWPSLMAGACNSPAPLTLHFIVGQVAADGPVATLMANLDASNLKLHCTPVVNLFNKNAEPIQVDHRRDNYPIVPDARHAAGYEIFSVDNVYRVQRQTDNDQLSEVRPFFSLQHRHRQQQDYHFYSLRRSENLAAESPGYETEISLVDSAFNLMTANAESLSLRLTCTNRDLPQQLNYGLVGGDLSAESTPVAGEITLLRKPSRSTRLATRGSARWQLISHLALDHMSLMESGASGLREMLRLYDGTGSPASELQIEGIQGFDFKATTAWLSRGKYRALARGLEATLTLNEDHFVGASLEVFVEVIDRFLGFYAPANSFMSLVVRSSDGDKELRRCPPRSGEYSLA